MSSVKKPLLSQLPIKSSLKRQRKLPVKQQPNEMMAEIPFVDIENKEAEVKAEEDDKNDDITDDGDKITDENDTDGITFNVGNR